MNDRFKFRVWNKKYNCYDFCRRKFGILYIQEKFRVSSGYDGDDNPTFCEDVNDNYIIEQCTGLSDKNGNLIYESDVLQSPSGRKFVVKWDGCYWLAECVTDKFFGGFLDDYLNYEIIGNIHENKGE